MKYFPLVTFLIITLTVDVFATPQETDYIIYNGEKHAFFTNPLSVATLGVESSSCLIAKNKGSKKKSF